LPDPLWNFIFNYSDLIILLQIYILFTADRKETARWLVRNCMIKHTVTFINEEIPDWLKMRPGNYSYRN